MYMSPSISPLAVDIFTAVKSARPNTVFLCNGAEDTVLFFGGTGTHKFRYHVSLISAGNQIEFSDHDSTPITIFLDQTKAGAVRLVIFAPQNGENFPGTLEYDSFDDTKNNLLGHLFFEAFQEGGDGCVVIHAVVAPGGKASLLMDSSPKLLRHIEIVTETWKAKEGGEDFVEPNQPTGIANFDSQF